MNLEVPTASVPDPEGPIQPILEFALTYNAYDRLCSADLGRLVSPVLQPLAKTGRPPEWAGIDLLRGTLFFIQRMTHHWGEIPPAEDRQMRALVDAIASRNQGALMIADPCV